jgi:peptidoglycan/xylan/chitin deacetylase (PgdA/CDA1 family)
MRKVMSFLIPILLIGCITSSSVLAAPNACGGGVVALTFDDGPTPETNAVLDALKLYGLKATFFVLGWNVQAYPDIAQRIVGEGHHIGNHTWDHRDLTLLTKAEIDQELRSTNNIIQQVTGVRPRFARPPYGSTNATVQMAMARNGLREVIWSQDSYDWAGASPDTILNQLTIVPPGGTFLMHDWTPNTLAAIPGIYWYFNTYWKASPICAGRLETTTHVQPVLDWMGLFYFAHAVRWQGR